MKPQTISADFAVAYTAAMYLAQQHEQNMRIILFLGDKFGLLPKFKLTAAQKRRFKDTQGFLDQGTSGALLQALNDAGLVKNRKALNEAVQMRNEVAHTFLAEPDFSAITDKEEQVLISRLNKVRHKLLYIVHATREIRESFQQQAELKHQSPMQHFFKFPIFWKTDDMPRYARRKKSIV